MSATVKAKKYLSQNFLINQGVQQKIVDAAQLNENDIVLEIGPGLGAITKLIAPKVKRLVAVEKDKSFIEGLRESHKGERVEIIHGDILKFPFRSLKEPFKLIGNLPYNISTPIIEKLIEEKNMVRSFYIMVQKEYAKRLCAPSGSKEYGALSCFAQYHAELKLLFLISKGSFRPAPKVDSAFIKGEFCDAPKFKARDEKLLFTLIRTAFNQRRKTLENALKEKFDKEKLMEAAAKAGVNLKKRAEELSLKDYVAIADFLAGN